jgi:hypothetical protein
LIPRDGVIVIARDARNVSLAQSLQNALVIRAVTHQVARAQNRVHVFAVEQIQNVFKRVNVAVNIGD